MKKVMLLIFIGILLISFTELISAHQLNESYDLVVSSNNATACNFTYIKYPNQTVTFYNLVMSQNTRDWSISITQNNFTETGEICMGVTCTDGSLFEVGSVCEDITPTGLLSSISYYIIILIFSLGIIIIGLWKKDAVIALLGSFGLYFFGIYILFYGIMDVLNIIYTRTIAIIILGLAFYISAKASHELMTG